MVGVGAGLPVDEGEQDLLSGGWDFLSRLAIRVTERAQGFLPVGSGPPGGKVETLGWGEALSEHKAELPKR